MDDHVWSPAASLDGQPLAPIDGAVIGDEVAMHVEVGPRTNAGHRRFRVWLAAAEHGRSLVPVLHGRHPEGPDPLPWLEVTYFEHQVEMTEGTRVEVPADIDRRMLGHLGSVIPPGGHLAVEYDSPGRRMTARALLAGAPPIVTPLGSALFEAGCGAVVRDWGQVPVGRGQARRLQGTRALTPAHAEARARELIPHLRRWLDRSGDLEWDLQAATRAVAQEVIAALPQRIRVATGLRANVI